MDWKLDRASMAIRMAGWMCLSATSFVLLPKGLAPFGALLVVLTAFSFGWITAAWPQCRNEVRWLALLALLVLAFTVVSMTFARQGWQEIDNPVRFLLMPWCALVVFALAPSRWWLWVGAMAGTCIGFSYALWQALSGMERAGAASNPIVFANAMLALQVVAVYCRPEGREARVLMPIAITLVLGIIAIVLSGSRGTLPGFGVMLLVAMIGSGGKKMWPRLALALGLLVGLLLTMWTVPWLAAQTRLQDIRIDLQNYAHGHVDSPIGARLQFLELSWDAFIAHPWTGIGLDRFGTLVDQLPLCRRTEHELHQPGVCYLNHAHNDVAQWSATMGIPGLLMILSIYLVPLLLFVRLIRAQRPGAPVGAAWAGAMLVSVYMLSGLTQSMFAHALTTTVYVVFVGLLAGLALRESAADLGQSLPAPRWMLGSSWRAE